MGVLSPAPTVLGSCSLTAAVELVCFIHLLACMFFVCNADSSAPMTLAGVVISPFMQCMTAAWFLLGIPIIVIGAVGAFYRIKESLTIYTYYLVATALVTVFWIFVFLHWGTACTDSQSSTTCGYSTWMMVFWMIMLIIAVILAIYLIWSMKDYLERRLETELIRYEEPWMMIAQLADDVAAEQAKELAMANPSMRGAGYAAADIPRPWRDYQAMPMVNPPLQPRVG